MAIVELAGEIRLRMGTGGSNQVRREGFIPGILYGEGEPSTPIKVVASGFDTLLRTPGGIHSVIDMKLPDHDDVMALVREIQRDPVSREVIHVDFQRISMDKPVHITVPIVLKGSAPGVKEGGILEHVLREIDVKCLPRDIPSSVEMSVGELGIGQSLHVRDIALADVEILTDGDRTIAIVAAPTVVAAEAEAAEGEAGEAEEGEGEAPKAEDEEEGGES